MNRAALESGFLGTLHIAAASCNKLHAVKGTVCRLGRVNRTLIFSKLSVVC
jgi:hypothetical protein